jgi:hypothetical protein
MNQRPFVSTQDCTHAELCGKRKASVEQKGRAVRVVDAKFPAPSFVGFPLCVGSKTRTSIGWRQKDGIPYPGAFGYNNKLMKK